MALRFSSNGGVMVENADELHKIKLEGNTLFLDLETTSFDRKVPALNVWHQCWPLGICVKSEKSNAYYIPINHADTTYNIDASIVQQWLLSITNETDPALRKDRWVNHNIKYDAHVLYNRLGIEFHMPLYDTLDLAKLIDSDRFRYSLDALSYDWLKHDITRYEQALVPYLQPNSRTRIQDYGVIPPDIMAEYGCQDVITNEQLWYYIVERIPAESKPLVEVSSKLIASLIEVERCGMPYREHSLKVARLETLSAIVNTQTELAEEVGYEFEPHINKACFDVLCNHYGLPVLEYTKPGEDIETGEPVGSPSFSMPVLKRYKAVPGAPLNVVEGILKCRRLNTFNNYFLSAWSELGIDELLHPSYNPTVRTGRMSCSRPNMQQLMDEAKRLIEPQPGHVLISADYRQIEFRMIIHYINDESCIAAYNANPDTDFHNWVRDMCKIDRTSAKTVNFLMGYGGGKNLLIANLMLVDTLAQEIWAALLLEQGFKDLPPEIQKQQYELRAKQHATKIFTTYHDTLPGIRITSYQATQRIYERGYVTNWFGRRRYMPAKFAHKAFNNLCQGSAADLMKERYVSLAYWLKHNAPEVKPIGVIHDEVMLHAPEAAVNDELLKSICFILEDTSRPFRIPIRTSIGVSTKSWYDVRDTDYDLAFDRDSFRPVNYQQTFDRGIVPMLTFN